MVIIELMINYSTYSKRYFTCWKGCTYHINACICCGDNGKGFIMHNIFVLWLVKTGEETFNSFLGAESPEP